MEELCVTNERMCEEAQLAVSQSHHTSYPRIHSFSHRCTDDTLMSVFWKKKSDVSSMVTHRDIEVLA